MASAALLFLMSPVFLAKGHLKSCSDQDPSGIASVLAWRLPGIGEPGGLPSTGSHRVGRDCRSSSSSMTLTGKPEIYLVSV